MHRQVFIIAAVLLCLAAGTAAAPIHEAVTAGDLERVKALVAADPSLVSLPDSALNLPLHLAALAGHVGMIEYLIERGAEVDAGDRENTRPLGCAALHGQYDAALALITHGASLTQTDDFGNTPILHALQGGSPALVRFLIERGVSLDVANNRGMSPLHAAAGGGNPELVELCLERGATVAAVDQNGYTPLHWAAFRNRAEAVRLLVHKGADREFRGGESGSTPLAVAAGSGAVEAARALIELGADVNYRAARGETLLHLASERGRIGVAELLIEHGFDVNATDIWGGTPLNHCVHDPEMIRWLLAHGASPEPVVDTATPPLYFAAAFGDTACVAALLAAGANVNVCDHDAGTPIHAAVGRGRIQAVDALLKAGADPNKTDVDYSQTALHTAVLTGRREVVSKLLDHGARVDVRDAQGHTPLYYAARYGHQTCADLLKARGASDEGSTDMFGTAERLSTAPGPGEAAAWYLGQSGWAIRTANHLLILDYNEMMGRPDLPCLRNGFIDPTEIADLPVTVFSTHEHSDHYDTVIFKWRDHVKSITYVLGHQPRDRQSYTYMEPRQSQQIDGMRVSTIYSTDAGVGYIIEVDGLTLFHAGDHSAGSVDLPAEYTAEIDYIAANWPKVDIAFMPITGCSLGTPESVQAGFLYAVNKIHPMVSVPQHAMNAEKLFAQFKTRAVAQGVTDSIICVEHRGDTFDYGGDHSI